MVAKLLSWNLDLALSFTQLHKLNKNNLNNCRVWAVRASRLLGTLLRMCVCVCLSVCSLHKCMSFKQQFEWRLHVTSRSKLLVRSGPVVVAHFPASWFRSSVQWASALRSAGLWSPTLCPAGAGSFVSIVRSSCASSVLGTVHAH